MFWEDVMGAAALLGGALVAVAVVLLFTRVLLPNWREQRLRAKSAVWPQVRAKLDHACVTEYRPSATEITYRFDAWFSYTVGGKIYDGMYMNEDMRLDDAKRLLRRVNHQPVMITYNPSKPAEYFYEPEERRTA